MSTSVADSKIFLIMPFSPSTSSELGGGIEISLLNKLWTERGEEAENRQETSAMDIRPNAFQQVQAKSAEALTSNPMLFSCEFDTLGEEHEDSAKVVPIH